MDSAISESVGFGPDRNRHRGAKNAVIDFSKTDLESADDDLLAPQWTSK